MGRWWCLDKWWLIVVITIFQHVRVSGKYPKMAECSWTTAHRRPWRFCCFLVFLHWFLQHFVLFSPCLWSVFQAFFLPFLFFFVQQPLAEPSLQEDTWSVFFLPLPQKFSFLPKGALTAESKNQICYSQRISSLTYQVADNRFRRWKRGMEVRSQIVESPLRKRMSSAKSFREAREKGRHWNPSHRQNLAWDEDMAGTQISSEH